MKFIPQFIPYWDEIEIKGVNKVLHSDYLNEHKTVRKFEKEFAKLRKANKALIDARETQIEEYNALLVEDAEKFDFHKIKLAKVPEDISTKQMAQVYELIEEE